jgi:hypothetical protein
MGASDGKHGSIGSTAIVLVFLLPLGAALWWIRLRSEAGNQMAANERSASSTLLLLAAAEEDFRQNDRDGNGIRDYWTLDVAGLNYLGGPAGPGRGASIQLIPRDLARADAAHLHDMPEGSAPYHGYFFKAIERDDTGAPYPQRTAPDGPAWKSLSKFAFCAYPAEYNRTGKWTYAVNESGRRFRIDSGGAAIRQWLEAARSNAWIPLE